MAKEKFNVKQVIAALNQSKGFLAPTASALSCSLSTVNNYIKKHSTIREALYEIKESRTDFVESKLFKAIGEDNLTAIIFYLKTQAKNRGYSEKSEVELTGKDAGLITVKVVRGVSMDDL